MKKRRITEALWSFVHYVGLVVVLLGVGYLVGIINLESAVAILLVSVPFVIIDILKLLFEKNSSEDEI
ncbi:hypothetical protein [Planktotalea sp.]|uniref:hypothetical protein n=1 Tax=Planktotalea sp. TaxID=2029877 RepID=UPI003D6C4A58